MRIDAPDNSLGPYLTNKGLDSIEIHFKTGIPVGSIRKMRSGETKAIPGGELYLISLIAKDEIEIVLQKVYPNLKLVKTDKLLHNNVKADTSEVGKMLFSLEEYNLDILAYRTGIKRDRLLRLTKLSPDKIQSHELYLIELGSNQQSGTLFRRLFKNLQLNSPEEEAKLRSEEKVRNSKK